MAGAHYIVGDIHGMLNKLSGLYRRISSELVAEDTLVFVGDYIDRGPSSFEVVEFLLDVAARHESVFLKGNHEDLFLDALEGRHREAFLENGGDATVQSYRAALGGMRLPDSHAAFFAALRLYHETDDFIAVHAGLKPNSYNIDIQDPADLMWIREAFYRNPRRWEKTIVFGHTPTMTLGGSKNVYRDRHRNIIGIDTGAAYGGPLSCIRMPDGRVFQY